MPKFASLNIGVDEEEPRCYNSIGCDRNWWFFSAKDMEEAIEKSIKGKYWEDDEEFETDLSKIIVIEYENVKVIEEEIINKQREKLLKELEEKRKEIEKNEEKIKEDEKVKKELEQLKCLQEKYSDYKS